MSTPLHGLLISAGRTSPVSLDPADVSTQLHELIGCDLFDVVHLEDGIDIGGRLVAIRLVQRFVPSARVGAQGTSRTPRPPIGLGQQMRSVAAAQRILGPGDDEERDIGGSRGLGGAEQPYRVRDSEQFRDVGRETVPLLSGQVAGDRGHQPCQRVPVDLVGAAEGSAEGLIDSCPSRVSGWGLREYSNDEVFRRVQT